MAFAPRSAARPAQLRGFRRATERARQSGQGLTTVVMFLLVPQVKLPKRLDVVARGGALVGASCRR